MRRQTPYILSVSPFLPFQARLEDVHPVEDEEHMKLRVALKIAIYSALYHNNVLILHVDYGFF